MCIRSASPPSTVLWAFHTIQPSSSICSEYSSWRNSVRELLHPGAKMTTSQSVDIVGRWLLPYLEPHFDNNQFGSRGGRSTAQCPCNFSTSALLYVWLDTGGSVRTVFGDFRKAFALVNDCLLFDKLQNVYVIPNCLHKWFGSYLTNRHQRARTNQLTSAWKHLVLAVPQTDNGPIAFFKRLPKSCENYAYVGVYNFCTM